MSISIQEARQIEIEAYELRENTLLSGKSKTRKREKKDETEGTPLY